MQTVQFNILQVTALRAGETKKDVKYNLWPVLQWVPTNEEHPYFVGAIIGSNGFVIEVWPFEGSFGAYFAAGVDHFNLHVVEAAQNLGLALRRKGREERKKEKAEKGLMP